MAMTFLELLVQGIPEMIAASALCFALAGAGWRWRWIVPVGIAQGVTIYLVRLLPIPFGVHGLIAYLLFAGYLYLLARTPLLRALYYAFLTLTLIIVYEYLASVLLFAATDLSFEEVKRNTLLWALFGWPQVIMLFVTALAVNRRRGRKSAP